MCSIDAWDPPPPHTHMHPIATPPPPCPYVHMQTMLLFEPWDQIQHSQHEGIKKQSGKQ